MARRIAFIATLWLAAGCSASIDPAGGSPDGSLASDSSAVVKPTPGVVDLPSSVIDPVVDEIARVADVPLAEVVVVAAESITFPNGGLGCPMPGFSYTQVQVDGYKVVAVAGGTTYDYRGTAAGVFRRCTQAGTKPTPQP